MCCSLSAHTITSYCGDVLPLWLVSDEDISSAEIVWGVLGDALKMTELSDNGRYTVNHGVLLIFDKIGQSTVFAEYKGKRYECSVVCRKMRTLSEKDEVSYYLGNFHDHTSKNHDPLTFPDREKDHPIDYINVMKQENLLDCTTLSDHAILMSKRDFFRTFADVERAQPIDVVVFPGNESDVSVRELDRFGIPHKNSGEVVCFNADNYVSCDSWKGFTDAYKNSPDAVCIFAHPQEMGGGNDGLWDFKFSENNSAELKRLIKGIELGNGKDIGSNAIQEYSYSCSLDAGFRVSTTLSSDWHANWSFNAYPGKTVVMAYEKSKEAFLDALNNMRFYGCESANLKLDIRVNGKAVPCDLEDTDKYKFKVDISYFTPDEMSVPKECKVISDYGKTVKKLENIDFSSFEFEIESGNARYFYLRFVDGKGRRTWSPPIFTGRVFDKPREKKLYALDKSDFTASEMTTGADVGVLVNNDPKIIWKSDVESAEIVIDMKKEYDICALGHYAPRCVAAEIKAAGEVLYEKISGFVSRYSIYVSKNGVGYHKVSNGIIRTFGNEEIIYFKAVKARYVKFVAESTVGAECGLEKYSNSKVSVAELSVFTDKGEIV